MKCAQGPGREGAHEDEDGQAPPPPAGPEQRITAGLETGAPGMGLPVPGDGGCGRLGGVCVCLCQSLPVPTALQGDLPSTASFPPCRFPDPGGSLFKISPNLNVSIKVITLTKALGSTNKLCLRN